MGQRGRPSKYKSTVPNIGQVERMAAKGFTNMDFADVFKVCYATFDNWLADHPELLGAIKRGRDKADKRVEESLFHRALGYSHKAVKIMQYEGAVIQQEYIEHYPPDTMAAMYWLNNRKPQAWRHKKDLEISGSILSANTAITKLPDEKLKKILEAWSLPDSTTPLAPDAKPA
jgi:hypothetical protein